MTVLLLLVALALVIVSFWPTRFPALTIAVLLVVVALLAPHIGGAVG